MGRAFHEGELAVQTRAGARDRAGNVARILASSIESDAVTFLESRPFLVLGTVDSSGSPWASQVSGRPPLLRVEGPTQVVIAGAVAASDPLLSNLAAPAPLAVLAIDFATRTRYRVNGVGELEGPAAIRLSVREAFGNCRKYIQARPVEPVPRAPSTASESESLSAAQRRWIRSADTFFIATAAAGGADTSHRGGGPGFVHVEADGALVVPDYAGNNMFQTLGNIALHPRAGLLFLDFRTGDTLQLTARAAIDWDPGRSAAFPGAQRLLRIAPERVLETRGAARVRGGTPIPSPFNP